MNAGRADGATRRTRFARASRHSALLALCAPGVRQDGKGRPLKPPLGQAVAQTREAWAAAAQRIAGAFTVTFASRAVTQPNVDVTAGKKRLLWLSED